MKEGKKLNYWKAATWSGLIAGGVMLVLEIILNSLIPGNSMWGPLQMMGSILLGKEVLPPVSPDAGVFLAALAVHLPLSVLFSFIIGYLIRKVSLAAAILIGIVTGYLIYMVNFFGISALLFPWFADARSWVQAIIHLLFGVTVAWSFKSIYKDPGVRPAQ